MAHPSLQNVLTAVQSLTVAMTKNLMIHLGVPLNALDDIEKHYSADNHKAYFVQKWLDIDRNASWERLVSTLRQIELPVLATDIESKFIPSATTQTQSPVVSIHNSYGYIIIQALMHSQLTMHSI